MAKRRLERILSSKERLLKLQNRGIFTCKDLLELNDFEVIHVIDEGREAVEALLDEVAARITPKIATAASLLAKRKSPDYGSTNSDNNRAGSREGFLSTGLHSLDQALEGGYPLGSLTELVGPAGAGKSQLCLLAAAAALAAAEGGVIYLDTERKFSAARFSQMLFNIIDDSRGETPDGDTIRSHMERVVVFHIDSSMQLTEQLQTLDEVILDKDAKLVVLDSIASLAHKDFMPKDTADRQNHLVQQAAILKQLADTFDIAVLAVNQVRPVFRNEDWGDQEGGAAAPALGGLAAALGNSWHHCVSTRLAICQLTSNEQWPNRRVATIQKSPLVASSNVFFDIELSGIQDATKNDK